jgi:hypothetical protein
MKSLTHIHFGTKVPREGVAIAHLQSPKLYASDAVTIVDISDQIPQNTFFEKEVRIRLDGNILNYYVDKKGFMITDKFRGQKPLYFKHELQKPIYLDADGNTDIIIVDKNGTTVTASFYLFDCGKNVIYHALDPENIYSVIYPRVDDSNNIIERRHRELLEAQPAFAEMGPTDLSADGCLEADADAYKIEELDGQPFYWRLTLPRPTLYAIQFTEDGLLKMYVPMLEQHDPWYIDINNTTLLTKQAQEKYLLRYAIAEFDVQDFYPFPPIRMVADKAGTIIAPGVIDVGEKRIILTTKTPVDVKIFAPDGTLTQALTTDQNKLGTSIRSIFWEVDLIESIDHHNGRVSIRRRILPGEIVKVSFYHEATAYRYNGYNFNPLYNSDAVSQRVAILVKPDNIGCISTISHVVLDLDDNVVSASDPDIDEWNTGSKTWDNLKTDWLYLPGESEGNQNNYLLLGLVSTSVPLAPEQVEIHDARRRGGGIEERLIEQALHMAPEASQNWDIGFWDGPREPVQGAIALYLPEYIRTVFTEEEIRTRVSKFAPAGSFFVIRYF